MELIAKGNDSFGVRVDTHTSKKNGEESSSYVNSVSSTNWTSFGSVNYNIISNQFAYAVSQIGGKEALLSGPGTSQTISLLVNRYPPQVGESATKVTCLPRDPQTRYRLDASVASQRLQQQES